MADRCFLIRDLRAKRGSNTKTYHHLYIGSNSTHTPQSRHVALNQQGFTLNVLSDDLRLSQSIEWSCTFVELGEYLLFVIAEISKTSWTSDTCYFLHFYFFFLFCIMFLYSNLYITLYHVLYLVWVYCMQWNATCHVYMYIFKAIRIHNYYIIWSEGDDWEFLHWNQYFRIYIYAF